MPKILTRGEPRSERMTVLVTPRTRQDLTKVATVRRTSVNEIINVLIADYLERNQNDIERYNNFFGEE